jgi:hypothetical protein
MDSSGSKLSAINAQYCSSSHRFDLSKQKKLTSLPPSSSPATSHTTSESNFSFITEIFFMSYYGLHVALIPVITQYSHILSLFTQTKNSVDAMKAKIGDGWRLTPEGEKLGKSLDTLYALIDSYNTQLMDTQFLELTCTFYEYSMLWMRSLGIPSTYNAPVDSSLVTLFASFPEFFVSDLAEFLQFLLRFRVQTTNALPNLFSNIISFASAFLALPSLVSGPIVSTSLFFWEG